MAGTRFGTVSLEQTDILVVDDKTFIRLGGVGDSFSLAKKYPMDSWPCRLLLMAAWPGS